MLAARSGPPHRPHHRITDNVPMVFGATTATGYDDLLVLPGADAVAVHPAAWLDTLGTHVTAYA